MHCLSLVTRSRWLKQTGLDTPDLGHLKRIRKDKGVTTLLLTTSLNTPTLPDAFGLPEPYMVFVPISAALTPVSLSLKSSFWPTIYAPPRKGEAEEWSRGKLNWAWEAVQRLSETANDARSRGEVSFSSNISKDVPEIFEIAANRCPYTFTVPVRGTWRRALPLSIHSVRHQKI